MYPSAVYARLHANGTISNDVVLAAEGLAPLDSAESKSLSALHCTACCCRTLCCNSLNSMLPQHVAYATVKVNPGVSSCMDHAIEGSATVLV